MGVRFEWIFFLKLRLKLLWKNNQTIWKDFDVWLKYLEAIGNHKSFTGISVLKEQSYPHYNSFCIGAHTIYHDLWW